MEANCPFCDTENISRLLIYEGREKKVAAICNFSPAMKGHCLVVPRKHVKSIAELSKTEISELFTVAEIIIEKLKYRFGYEAFTSFWLVGKYRTVSHFHLHIIPDMIIKSRTQEEKMAARLSPEQISNMVQGLRIILN